MRKHRMGAAVVAALLAAGIGVAAGPSGAAPGANADATAATGVDQSLAIVQLTADPLATAPRTKPAKGKKIDFSSTAVKSQRALLSAQRNDFKRWLRANAPKAKVTGEFDIAVNAVGVKLNGTPIAKLRTAPMVKSANYQAVYRPLGGAVVTRQVAADAPVDPDLSLVNWPNDPTLGTGVKVAIVDSGIDANHPCFDGMGDTTPDPLTNNKVIYAGVYNMKAANRGLDAADWDGHGTHVAGTVACDYQTAGANVQGATIPYGVSGVAPSAQLGNFNVFPKGVDNARSEDILNALDDAYELGFDVANMSLGGNAHGIQDLLTVAIDNLDQAGFLSAVAAGNSGPGYFTVESPGSAARALTAGASTVAHNVANVLRYASTEALVVVGEFGSLPMTGQVVAITGTEASPSGLSLACNTSPALPPGTSGQIALISRNVCTFSEKIRNVQAAGYGGAIVVNREETAFVMGGDGTPSQPTIPAVMIALTPGVALKTAAPVTATVGAAEYIADFTEPNWMVDFSSQGPTDVDRRVKPDLVAPGANVLSAQPSNVCGTNCWAFYNGTSMATPHLAGAAAAVKSKHVTWSPADIRSAITNTANPHVLSSYTGAPNIDDPNIVGTGLLDVTASLAATATIDPVSVSFGTVPSGSGQTRTVNVSITNRGASAVAVSVSSAKVGAATFSVPATTIGAGQTAVVPVKVTVAKGAAAGPSWSRLNVRPAVGGHPVAQARLFVLIG